MVPQTKHVIAIIPISKTNGATATGEMIDTKGFDSSTSASSPDRRRRLQHPERPQDRRGRHHLERRHLHRRREGYRLHDRDQRLHLDHQPERLVVQRRYPRPQALPPRLGLAADHHGDRRRRGPARGEQAPATAAQAGALNAIYV
jgi:hypothetical protein